MIIAVFTLGIILGYIRKGSLKNLVSYKVKLVPLILLSFVMQVSIYFAYKYNIGFIQDYDILIHFISYIILFAGLMGNFDNKWFVVITVGIVLNFIVIFLNGGKMPVSLAAGEKIGLDETTLLALLAAKTGTHQLLESDALLGILGDIIPFSLPGALSFFSNIYSVGDIVMFAGILGLLQSLMISSRDEDEVDELQEKDNSYKNFKPMDSLEEMLLFEQKSGSVNGETAVEVQQNQGHSQETIVLNTSKATNIQEEQSVEEEISLNDATAVISGQEADFTELDSKSSQEEDLMDAEKEESDQMYDTEENEPVVDDTPQTDLNAYKEQQQTDYEEIDTIHQFIIINGKIKENPNYHLPIQEKEVNQEEEPVEATNQDENSVEELELSHTDLQEKNQKNEEESYMLQNLTDSDRIELMKKMKKRKADGYTLVEITVGGKKINFWKKDL